MLFDLRGRGRRRAVQVIYLSLAILMGGGLVLFGIGGATSGGLFDAFKSDSRHARAPATSSRSASTTAEAAVQAQPDRPRRVGRRSRACATSRPARGDGFDANQNVFTDKGKQELRRRRGGVGEVPRRSTKKPDDTVASLMVQAFGQVGPQRARQGRRGAGDHPRPPRSRPGRSTSSSPRWPTRPGQTRKAELASKKALALTPKDDREQIKAQLESARGRPRLARREPARRATDGHRRRVLSPAEQARGRRSLAILSGPAPVAQLAEQRTLNPKVLGSIPSRGHSGSRTRGACAARLRGAVPGGTAPTRRSARHPRSSAREALLHGPASEQDRLCSVLLMVW